MEDSHAKHKITPFDVLSFCVVLVVVGWLLVATIYGVAADIDRRNTDAEIREALVKESATVRESLLQEQKRLQLRHDELLEEVNEMKRHLKRIEVGLKMR